MRSAFFLVLICPCLLLATSCSSLRTTKIPPQGQTRFQKLAPPTSVGRYHLQPSQTAIAPVLRHHVSPVYPPNLVHAGAEPVTVIARIVIDRDGKVVEFQPVIKKRANLRYAHFVTAVRSAVMQWRFFPFRVQTPKQDGTVSQVSMPVTLRYVFHFMVAHGEPTVRVGRG